MKATRDPLGWLGSSIDGRFPVEAVVGEGGFGIVYRARHPGLGVPVAIKCLKLGASLSEEERTTFLTDFRAEARLLHELSRKNAGIVQALDVGAAVSPLGIWTPYIVMEWLDGETLEHELRRRAADGRPSRSLAEATALLAPVAESLAVAHARSVAHLDVKPANVFLASDGTVKLFDFGIAKVLAGTDTMRRSATAEAVGPFTPLYAAPEQFNRRHGATGPWTDVFALVLILIEVCSGEPALVGDSPLELYVAAANEQFRPSLAGRGLRVSTEVEAVVRRAVDVDPRARFTDAGELWQALARALESPSLTGAATAPRPHVSITPASREGLASSRAPTTVAGVSLPTAQNRVCTVLVAEIAGAGELAGELDPTHVTELLERLTTTMAASVRALGGQVERVLGDGLMAVFGVYDDSASAAERAVHAALRMVLQLGEPPVPKRLRRHVDLGVRTGVSTGRVHLQAQQTGGGFTLAATGVPLKLATRLMHGAAVGAVLVDGDTYRQVAGFFEVEPVEMPTERGQTAVRAHRVVGLARDRHALAATAVRDFHGIETKLVGRVAEMEALGDLVEICAGEPCARFVTVLGGAGVGKSRLLVELADRLERDEWTVLAAHGSAIFANVGYALIAAMLRWRFHIHEDDAPDVVAGKLRRGLRMLRGLTTVDSMHGMLATTRGGLDEVVDVDEVIEQLLALLGARTEEAPRSVDQEGAGSRHRMAQAVSAMLRLSRRPVAVICDDLHLCDDASLALLEDLCVRMGDTTLIVIGSARPELLERRPLWGEGEQAHVRIELGPFSRGRLEEMARDRLRRVVDLPPDTVRRLAEEADGSPLVLVETLHLLVDLGVVDTSDAERWTMRGELLHGLRLPATVHGIVQARLDRLATPARDLLTRAAVVGRTFWQGALVAVQQAEEGVGIGELLASLRERGLIRARANSTFPEELEYVFAEAAVHQVAYEMLGASERRGLHRAIAAWLEARTQSQATTALVAHHYERAAALEEALAAYQRAGAHAAGLGQHAEALSCLERACRIDDLLAGADGVGETTRELLAAWDEPDDYQPRPWPSRVSLRVVLGDVLRHMGRFDAAEVHYERARTLIPEAGAELAAETARWQAQVDHRLALLAKHRGRVDEARALLEKGVEAAAAGGLVEEQAEMWALYASILRRAGQLEQCRRACMRGLRVCRDGDRQNERWRLAVSKLLNALGAMYFTSGRHVRAERCYLEAARIVDERRSPDQVSQAINNVAAARYGQGNLAGARVCFERALKLTDRSGDLWMKMTALGNLGEVELGLGNHGLACEHLQECVRLGEQIHARIDLAEFQRNLARARLAAKQPAAALEAAGRALDIALTEGGRMYLGPVLVTASEVGVAVAKDEGEASAGARALTSRITDVLAAADRHALPADTVRACRERLAAVA
jgi:serine/threonine protein kinase/tetratricopeptide (TPR) repeat protein